MPLLKHPLRRRMHCTPAAEGSSCNLTLPAAGLAVLQLRLPGAAPDGSPPEPCTATFQTVLAPSLVLRCLLGVWLVLFAHRALATRPGQAALRLCNAAAQAAAPWKRQLRAAWAAAAGSAAAVAFIRAHIDDWPTEGRWAPCCRSCRPTHNSWFALLASSKLRCVPTETAHLPCRKLASAGELVAFGIVAVAG